MKNSSAVFIEEINKKRADMGIGNMSDAEEALVEYNFDTINTGERPSEMVKSIGLQIFLFGIQDHIDPVLNAEFTLLIKTLTNSLNRGVHDIIILREVDIMASSKMGQLKRMAKDGVIKAGHDLSVMIQRPGEELALTLERAFSLADNISKKNPAKLPKIFLDLAYGNADAETLNKVSGGLRAFVKDRGRENMTIIVEELIENLPSGEYPKTDLGKLIIVASGLLDDKRKSEDFNMSAEELFDSRKTMISVFERSGIIELTKKYDTESAKGLNEIINDIETGILRMRITRINWEEITDWFEANTEVMRSL